MPRRPRYTEEDRQESQVAAERLKEMVDSNRLSKIDATRLLGFSARSSLRKSIREVEAGTTAWAHWKRYVVDWVYRHPEVDDLPSLALKISTFDGDRRGEAIVKYLDHEFSQNGANPQRTTAPSAPPVVAVAVMDWVAPRDSLFINCEVLAAMGEPGLWIPLQWDPEPHHGRFQTQVWKWIQDNNYQERYKCHIRIDRATQGFWIWLEDVGGGAAEADFIAELDAKLDALKEWAVARINR